ncbi:MAG: T9SS type A sorting domain-containing protein [Chitinophagales bacterium]|nr:T9SS type A sorting domain-containing protein [Chitinophagales bacterium]
MFSINVSAVQYNDSLVLRPGPFDAKDVSVSSLYPSQYAGNDENFICNAWTVGGKFMIQRSYIGFNLASIPANANITSAYLSLYCNTTSLHTQRHSMYPGSPYDSNKSFLMRVISGWNDSMIWNNQPATTAKNQVVVPVSTSKTQDYLNINVLGIVNDAWTDTANHDTSVSFMLKLETEQTFRSLIFASGDHPDSTKRPLLVVHYTYQQDTVVDTNVIVNTIVDNRTKIKVFPNPAADRVFVNTSDMPGEGISLSLFDVLGRVLYQQDITLNEGNSTSAINLSGLPSGTYRIVITLDSNEQHVFKLLKT